MRMLLFVSTAVISSLIHGIVIHFYWGWFIEQIVHRPSPGIMILSGIALLIGYLFQGGAPKEVKEPMMSDVFNSLLWQSILAVSYLIFGFVVYQFSLI
ncbi:hypothetical protein ISR92_02840 [Patescibacteria group bacterium]|nr:hypothetical protein [Patescibacteria group bacterium]